MTKYFLRGAIAIVVVAVLSELFGSSLQGLIAESQGKNATLSDRTYLWNDVIRIGMHHPILGSGYGGFWVPSTYDQLSPEVDNGPQEAHNGYLETFANLGLVGDALLAFVLIQSLHSSMKLMRDDFEYARLRLCLLVTVMVMNYSEATFTVGNHLWWFGFLAIALYARPWVLWPEQTQPVLNEMQEEVAHQEQAVPA